MLKEAKIIYELIAVERGHFYVCGDCKMAENVYQTLKSIIQEQTGMNSAQSDNFMLGLRVRKRARRDLSATAIAYRCRDHTPPLTPIPGNTVTRG